MRTAYTAWQPYIVLQPYIAWQPYIVIALHAYVIDSYNI